MQMGRTHSVFHASLLEPYCENSWEGHVQEPPPPDEVEGELEYEVQEILDSKLVQGKLMYLVDWVGYGQEERTWEPAENVEHAEEAVADFHRAHPERPSLRDLPIRPRGNASNRPRRPR